MGTPMMAALKLLSSPNASASWTSRGRDEGNVKSTRSTAGARVVLEARAAGPVASEIRGDQTRALGRIEIAETTRGLSPDSREES